jgi:hypothetical protein
MLVLEMTMWVLEMTILRFPITKVQSGLRFLSLDEAALILQHGSGTSTIRTFGIRSA